MYICMYTHTHTHVYINFPLFVGQKMEKIEYFEMNRSTKRYISYLSYLSYSDMLLAFWCLQRILMILAGIVFGLSITKNGASPNH